MVRSDCGELTVSGAPQELENHLHGRGGFVLKQAVPMAHCSDDPTIIELKILTELTTTQLGPPFHMRNHEGLARTGYALGLCGPHV